MFSTSLLVCEDVWVEIRGFWFSFFCCSIIVPSQLFFGAAGLLPLTLTCSICVFMLSASVRIALCGRCTKEKYMFSMKSTLIYLTWNHSCSSKKGQTRAQDDTKNDSHTIKLVLDIYESLEVGSREHTASVHWCVKVQWSVNLVSKKVRLWKRLNWFQNFKHCTHHQNSKKAKNGCALQPNRHDIRSIGGVPSMKCLKLGCADHFDRSCEGPKWPVTLLTIISSINVYPLLRVTEWFVTWTPLVICSSLLISSTWVQFILISEKSGTLLCYV